MTTRPAPEHRRVAVGPVGMTCTTGDHDAIKADPERWSALELLGVQMFEADHEGSGGSIELRNCACGSTLGKFLPKGIRSHQGVVR